MGDNKNLLGGIFYLLTPDIYGDGEYSNEQRFSNIKTLPYDKLTTKGGQERITVQEEVKADYSPFELVKEADEKLRKPLDTENTNILYDKNQTDDYKKFKQMIEALANYCNKQELEILKEQWISKGGNEEDFELFKECYDYSYDVEHDLKIKFNLNGRIIEIGRLLQELFYNPYLFRDSISPEDDIMYGSKLAFMNIITSPSFKRQLNNLKWNTIPYTIEVESQNGRCSLTFIFPIVGNNAKSYYKDNQNKIIEIVNNEIYNFEQMNKISFSLEKSEFSINVDEIAQSKTSKDDYREVIGGLFQSYKEETIKKFDKIYVEEYGYEKKQVSEDKITYFRDLDLQKQISFQKKEVLIIYNFKGAKQYKLNNNNETTLSKKINFTDFDKLLENAERTFQAKTISYTYWWNKNKTKINKIIEDEKGGWKNFLSESANDIFGYFVEYVFPLLAKEGGDGNLKYKTHGYEDISIEFDAKWLGENSKRKYDTKSPADISMLNMGGFQAKARSIKDLEKFKSIKAYDPTEFASTDIGKLTSKFVSLFDIYNNYSIVQFIGEDRYPYFMWLARNAAFLNKKMNQNITSDMLKTYLSFCFPTFFRFSTAQDFRKFKDENIGNQVFFFIINFSLIPVSFVLKHFIERIKETGNNFYKDLFDISIKQSEKLDEESIKGFVLEKNSKNLTQDINKADIPRSDKKMSYAETKTDKNLLNENMKTAFYRFKGYEVPIEKIIGLDYIFGDLGSGW